MFYFKCSFQQIKHLLSLRAQRPDVTKGVLWGDCLVSNTSSPPSSAQITGPRKAPPRAWHCRRTGRISEIEPETQKGVRGQGWFPVSPPAKVRLEHHKSRGNSIAPQKTGVIVGAPPPVPSVWGASAGFWFQVCVYPEETQNIKLGQI